MKMGVKRLLLVLFCINLTIVYANRSGRVVNLQQIQNRCLSHQSTAPRDRTCVTQKKLKMQITTNVEGANGVFYCLSYEKSSGPVYGFDTVVIQLHPDYDLQYSGANVIDYEFPSFKLYDVRVTEEYRGRFAIYSNNTAFKIYQVTINNEPQSCSYGRNKNRQKKWPEEKEPEPEIEEFEAEVFQETPKNVLSAIPDTSSSSSSTTTSTTPLPTSTSTLATTTSTTEPPPLPTSTEHQKEPENEKNLDNVGNGGDDDDDDDLDSAEQKAPETKDESEEDILPQPPPQETTSTTTEHVRLTSPRSSQRQRNREQITTPKIMPKAPEKVEPIIPEKIETKIPEIIESKVPEKIIESKNPEKIEPENETIAPEVDQPKESEDEIEQEQHIHEPSSSSTTTTTTTSTTEHAPKQPEPTTPPRTTLRQRNRDQSILKNNQKQREREREPLTSTTPKSEPTTTTQKISTPEPEQIIPKSPLNEENCGVPQKIVDLKQYHMPSNLGQFPYAASIYQVLDLDDIYGNSFYKCSGSIINRRMILTSVNCLLDHNARLIDENNLLAYVGHYSTTGRRPHSRIYDVEQVLPHESYNYNLENNIAALRLKRSIEFDDMVQPACLPEPSMDLEDDSIGKVVGFGKENTLSEGEFNISLDEDCKDEPSSCKTINGNNTSGNVGSTDLGCGLFMNNSNHFIVIGVVSIIPHPLTQDYGCIFTNVLFYLDWINKLLI